MNSLTGQWGVSGSADRETSDWRESHRAAVIDETEEMQRHSELVERENILRSLGVVESVYRLLHGTPGTTGSIRPRLNAGVGVGVAAPPVPEAAFSEHFERSTVDEPMRVKPVAALPAGNPVGRVRTL